MTRHPVITTVAVIVGLGILAIPAASLELALPNAGMQPTSSEARQAYDLTSEHFGPGFNGPLIMTGTIVTSTDPLGLMEDLATEIEKIPGVKTVALATPNETADTGIIQLVPETAPDDPATAELVRDLRAQHDRLLDEYGVDLKVTGFTAVAIDISDRLGGALLPFGIFVVGLSLILLTMVFRSIWVPIKAALGYLLSVAAAFGVVAAVFEWGWLAEPLHVDKTGPMISFMPIIVMGVLFGLAMDYEVFLVSRMREDFVHARARAGGADRALAVATVRSGFTASARVVTAAAVIMFAVFAAFVPEGDASLKPIALGLAVGIAIDAFFVRMTLVPAVMALLGEKAWWMPRWLDRVLPRFDIEGEAVERELALADWPEPETTAVVVAEGLSLADDDVELYSAASLRLERGESLVVTSADPRAARALLLTIAGRVAPTDGRLRVAGHLLPERAAWVRAHVGVALLDPTDDPIGELRRAVRGGPSIVVIDNADALGTVPVRDRAAAVLRDAGSPVADHLGERPGHRAGAARRITPPGRRRSRPLRFPASLRGALLMTANRLTMALERARTRRPVTWITLIGVLLLPVVIGGILVAALYNPVERLDGLNAAIVNEDEPVTIDDQYVPLGRQLTAGSRRRLRQPAEQPHLDALQRGRCRRGTRRRHLCRRRDDPGELLRRCHLHAARRDTGARDHRSGDAARQPHRRRRHHRPGDDGRGIPHGDRDLEGVPRERVPRLHDARRPARHAADGATQLADGAQQAADGAAALPGGATQLGDGARSLASGAGELGTGLGTIADKTREAASGAGQLASGVQQGADAIRQNGLVPAQITDLAEQTATTAATSAQAAAGVLAIAQNCVAAGAPQAYCDQLLPVATGADAAATGTAQLAAGTQQAWTGSRRDSPRRSPASSTP